MVERQKVEERWGDCWRERGEWGSGVLGLDYNLGGN